MPGILSKLLRVLRERRGTDMSFICRHLLSERGEASQTALAQEIINAYQAMNDGQRVKFLEMLSRDFAPSQAAILSAAADYQRTPGPSSLAALSAAVESPRQDALNGKEFMGRVLNVNPVRPKTEVQLFNKPGTYRGGRRTRSYIKRRGLAGMQEETKPRRRSQDNPMRWRKRKDQARPATRRSDV